MSEIKQPVTIRLTDTFKQQMDDFANERGWTRQRLIEEALTLYMTGEPMEHNESDYNRLEKRVAKIENAMIQY